MTYTENRAQLLKKETPCHWQARALPSMASLGCSRPPRLIVRQRSREDLGQVDGEPARACALTTSSLRRGVFW